MRILPVPVREDNYAYLIVDESANEATAVDPYDFAKVEAAAKEQGVRIVANITTHHHFDHSGGNKDFATAYSGLPIYGGSKQVTGVTKIVKDKEELSVGNIHIQCLATPCHTQDSICYYVTDKSKPEQVGAVFTGDTLFQAGCGRFFEGTGEQMHAALSYLSTLPNNTVVYSGHEYTASNLAFGRSVEPNNAAMDRLRTMLDSDKVSAGKGTIGDEKAWNVFMRLDSEAVRNATGTSADTPPSEVIDQLREMKNKFRG